jgi:hypothetical protein
MTTLSVGSQDQLDGMAKLYIGKDRSSFENSLVTGLFYLIVLLLIFCILFIVMLIYDLLGSEDKITDKTENERKY